MAHLQARRSIEEKAAYTRAISTISAPSRPSATWDLDLRRVRGPFLAESGRSLHCRFLALKGGFGTSATDPNRAFEVRRIAPCLGA